MPPLRPRAPLNCARSRSPNRPLFERACEIVTRCVLAGEQFDAPIPQDLQKLPTRARPDVAEAALAAMRAVLHRLVECGLSTYLVRKVSHPALRLGLCRGFMR